MRSNIHAPSATRRMKKVVRSQQGGSQHRTAHLRSVYTLSQNDENSAASPDSMDPERSANKLKLTRQYQPA